MEQFYKNLEADFTKWLELNQLLIEKNVITPKQIFEHAYALGALQELKSRNGATN
jgi:hypothetical protein